MIVPHTLLMVAVVVGAAVMLVHEGEAQASLPEVLQLRMNVFLSSSEFVTGPGIAFGVLLAQFNGRANRTSEVLLQPQVFPAEIAAYTPWLNAITGPDVVEVYLGGGGLDLLSSDNFEDVTDIWTNSSLDLDLLPAAMASSTGADGRRYGVPLMVERNSGLIVEITDGVTPR